VVHPSGLLRRRHPPVGPVYIEKLGFEKGWHPQDGKNRLPGKSRVRPDPDDDPDGNELMFSLSE